MQEWTKIAQQVIVIVQLSNTLYPRKHQDIPNTFMSLPQVTIQHH